MNLSVELTYYPLKQEDHITAIQAVIAKLNAYANISVKTFPTATIVIGEHAEVMNMLSEVIEWAYGKFGKSVFVAKFLPDYEAR